MFGMENIGDIQRLGFLWRGFGTVEQVKEMGGFTQIFSDLGQIETVSGSMEISDDHADFSQNRHRSALVSR